MKRQAKKIVHKNLDAIYKTSSSIAKKWGTKQIPLTMFKVIISKAKPSEDTEIENVNEFNAKYNICLDNLYNACETIANNMGAKSIPLIEVKKGLNIIKTVLN